MNFFKDNKGTCLQKAGTQFHSAPNARQNSGESGKKLKDEIYDVNMHEKNASIYQTFILTKIYLLETNPQTR